MGKIYIVDVTNRDGVQTAKLGLAKLAKTMLNIYLNEMGIFQSEFGFPTTRHESNYLRANLKLQDMGGLQPIRLGGWVRATSDDVKKAFNYVPELKDLNLSISTSKQMIRGKFLGKKTEDDILGMAVEAIDTAKYFGVQNISINAEDASRTSMRFLKRFASAAKEHGVHRLRYCDTLGYDNPSSIYRRCRTLAGEVGIDIGVHCHNDLGMAVANTLSGAIGVLDAGQDAYVNTTVNGIGERAGNADLAAVILALTKSRKMSRKYEFGMPVDLSKAWKICKYASYAFDVPIPINQP